MKKRTTDAFGDFMEQQFRTGSPVPPSPLGKMLFWACMVVAWPIFFLFCFTQQTRELQEVIPGYPWTGR